MKDNISKFLDAQNVPGYAGYENAVTELKRGKKLSHWIWYVFPQLKSISQNSPYEKKYGIEDLEEARDYLRNPILKSRLDEVCGILLNHQGKTASGIFGLTDAAKVKSSMTLFYLASKDEIYRKVLDKYFNGLPCQKTLYALNLTMPSYRTITTQEKIAGKDVHHNRATYKKERIADKQSNVILNSKGSHFLNTKKVKKIMVLIVGAIVIVGVFGGIGYGGYALLFSDKSEEPIEDNRQSEVDKPTIPDKMLSVVLTSSDCELIGKEEIEKYLIRVSASFGGKTCAMDTISNRYNFRFTNQNYNDSVVLNATIEDCSIGKATYFYPSQEVGDDTIEESVVLSVSSKDLRIYEELAWYVSANRKVSESKYPQYIERIKGVKDKQFATLLTQKLNSVGMASPKTTNPIKHEYSEENNDNLPSAISSRVRHGVLVSRSHMETLNLSQRAIIEEYNHFIRRSMDGKHRESVLHFMRGCKTFKSLKHVLRAYRWEER